MVDEYIDQIDPDRDSIRNVVILEKINTDENYASDFGKEFIEDQDFHKYTLVYYDTTAIKLLSDQNVQEALIKLESEFENPLKLDHNSFELKTSCQSISNARFRKYFTTLFGQNISKGWRKFYKRYPNVFGIFGFSRIQYSSNHAAFYMEHRVGGLYGSGDIIIMTRVNGDWHISKILNIWMA